MLALARAGQLGGWILHEDRIGDAADFVAATIRIAWPDLRVPLHARWRHFAAGGRDRWAPIAARSGADRAARARAAFDLAIVSVLLDAGAGAEWRYVEQDGTRLVRSEGLAVASLAMLAAGAFADDGRSLRADAARLAATSEDDLARGFQVGPENPLVGLAGRAALLRCLGATIAARPDIFARADTPRPGGLFDLLAGQAESGRLPARSILIALLHHLGPIWAGRETLGGVGLGDCWRHPALGLVPLHKLSQWMAYSLVEPLRDAGIVVTGLDGLTGLAEYRNGGLFVDLGVLCLRDPADAARTHAVGDPLVVEWRALTVALLDELAPMVRARLDVTAEAFPLTCLLEGGTWRAGRDAATARRADSGPPLRIASDGTVF
ncbi:MAG: DUF1688 family protein [Acetobacteraceae bacterium]|nr:DUF1688 family protein [Acetobacteraceae bacterium]